MNADYHSLCVNAVDAVWAKAFTSTVNQAPKSAVVEKLIRSWEAERRRVSFEGLTEDEIHLMSSQRTDADFLRTLIQVALKMPDGERGQA
jgi:hypothetical protein